MKIFHFLWKQIICRKVNGSVKMFLKRSRENIVLTYMFKSVSRLKHNRAFRKKKNYKEGGNTH